MNLEDFFKLDDVHYEDWFGTGTLKQDVRSCIKNREKEVLGIYVQPEHESGTMALIEFETVFEVVGYDGNEYTHFFYFPKQNT